MNDKTFKHIFLPGPTETTGFKGRGFDEPKTLIRDRILHSDYLRRQLEVTWLASENKQAVAHTDRAGTYIEFKGESGCDLEYQSLEAKRSGIRLLNVRKSGEGDQEQTLATIYVPNDKRGHLLKKITDYAEKLTITGKPKNQKLINSISDIRLAVLESFWQEDDKHKIPKNEAEWVELWINSEQDETLASGKDELEDLGIESQEDKIKFPERTVLLIKANREQLEQLITQSDNVAEFRPAKKIASYFIELENVDQAKHVDEILKRCEFTDDQNVSVCILDTGINNGHPLLAPVLNNSDLHTQNPDWGVSDHSGHGTLMAGTAIYGDLLNVLNNPAAPLIIEHRLESVMILPSPDSEPNPKHLWGAISAQGIARAEIEAPDRLRIICMAITAYENPEEENTGRGKPTSWSGEIDKLASGAEDGKQRLIIISGGNIDDKSDWNNYFKSNLTKEIQDPGQAWNALTVGASTHKTLITDPYLKSYEPIAPEGGFSPFSSTSLPWQKQWPIKPEVVFEGGNVARGPDEAIFATDDLKLLSTYYQTSVAHFGAFDCTSAASAQAALMAAKIQVLYPEAWPETIRGLIVHSADWTPTMREQFLHDEKKGSYGQLLRICGYGIPDLDRALYCAKNTLTLISESTIQPYSKNEKENYGMNEMHFYNLPWPKDILEELAEQEVSMRITLSYFVEPSPGEIGWKKKYRYASHGLRFDINGAGESEEDFMKRVNAQAREEDDGHPGTSGTDNWKIGTQARSVGSIHSDIWKGNAADLAASNLIVVYPVVGWWRERPHLNRWNSKCRYSLIVSIITPELDVDIYTPVLIKVEAKIPVEITADR